VRCSADLYIHIIEMVGIINNKCQPGCSSMKELFPQVACFYFSLNEE